MWCILIFFLFTSTTSIDQECYMIVPEIARHFGYTSESHIVRTEDDYILELHRIPHGINNSKISKNRAVILLQHGLLADGFNFAANLPHQSAGFVFADAGFDVWISNSRGTPCSQKHIGYGPEDARFWNFSWQEMSTFDMTATVKYILKETNQDSLYFVGHSQGTVIMFARLAEDPQFAKKIRQFHALAPVATVGHIGGLFKIFGAKFYGIMEFLLRRVPNTPLQLPSFIQRIMSIFCSLPIASEVCTLDIGFIDGKETQYNKSRVGVYLCHTPAATSSKDLRHWIQVVKSRRFEKYDYGVDGNMIEYGQSTPPTYNLSNINTPTYIYWSKDDILADTDDIRDTIIAHMNHTIVGMDELLHYSHIDFIFGLNATREVYTPIINRINNDMEERKRKKFHKYRDEMKGL